MFQKQSFVQFLALLIMVSPFFTEDIHAQTPPITAATVQPNDGLQTTPQAATPPPGAVIAQPGDDLQTKIDEAVTGSGKLFIEQGTYRIGSTLHIDASISIEGASQEGVQIRPASTGFSGPNVMEIVSIPGYPSVRGVHLSNFTIAWDESFAPSTQVGLFMARTSNSLECNQHVIDHIRVLGKLTYAVAILGVELSTFKDCYFRADSLGGVGFYACPKNIDSFVSVRLNGNPQGGTTTFNRVQGCTIGGADICVYLEGYVHDWTFESDFLAPQVGSEAAVLLHGLAESECSTLSYPMRIRMSQCGNDTANPVYGIKITTDQACHNAVDGLTLQDCWFSSLHEGIWSPDVVDSLVFQNTSLLWGRDTSWRQDATVTDRAPMWFEGLRYSWVNLRTHGARVSEDDADYLVFVHNLNWKIHTKIETDDSSDYNW